MPAAARKGDKVNTIHPASGDANIFDGIQCDVAPIDTATDECSTDVFINGKGAVREDDKVAPHTFPSPGCLLHAPGLVSFSSSVRINGKKAGRVGDTYDCGAEITEGSDDVNIGG